QPFSNPYPSRLPVGPVVAARTSVTLVFRPGGLAIADLAAQSPDDAEDVHESRRRAEHEKHQQEPRLGSQPPIEQKTDADADDQRRNDLNPDPQGEAQTLPLEIGARLRLTPLGLGRAESFVQLCKGWQGRVVFHEPP